MLKKQLLFSYTILLMVFLFQSRISNAQMVGPDAYIKATSVEIGIAGSGGYEGANTMISPPIAGMHARSSGTGFFWLCCKPS